MSRWGAAPCVPEGGGTPLILSAYRPSTVPPPSPPSTSPPNSQTASSPPSLVGACRFLKDYVLCHGTAPRHTTTYSTGTFPEDEVFTLDAWRSGFKVHILEIEEDNMVFDMSGIDVAVTNAFRRVLLSEVPTMAIEKVFITNNNGVLRDELLAHRLGLIPIKVDPASFHFPSPETEAATDSSPLNEDEVLKFRLKVKCRREPGASKDEPPINSKIFSSQLEWVPIGDQVSEARRI